MQQWEYCAILGVNKSERSFTPKWPLLVYFTKKGLETVNLADNNRSERPAEWQDAGEADYVAHMVAILGLDGWEMVNAFARPYGIDSAGATALYFRRPIVAQ